MQVVLGEGKFDRRGDAIRGRRLGAVGEQQQVRQRAYREPDELTSRRARVRDRQCLGVLENTKRGRERLDVPVSTFGKLERGNGYPPSSGR